MNGAPLTRTPPRQSWGRGPSPQGWRRLQARRSTCLLLRALQRRRVESLVLGALSSSPVHRALVLVLGTNIAVLLDCSKSSRQCSLPSLLTYLLSSSCRGRGWGGTPRGPCCHRLRHARAERRYGGSWQEGGARAASPPLQGLAPPARRPRAAGAPWEARARAARGVQTAGEDLLVGGGGGGAHTNSELPQAGFP